MLEITGSRSEIVEMPLPEDDPQVRCPDIHRAESILGWSPKVPLSEGLHPTIDWFRREVTAVDAE